MADLAKEFEFEVESFSLVPSDGGKFEVSLGDQLVFSKKQLGRHAEDGEVLGLMRPLIPTTQE